LPDGKANSANGDLRPEGSPPRLLYVVSEDWYFLSHRLPMARAARDAGFEVHVATNVRDGAATSRYSDLSCGMRHKAHVEI